MSLHAVLSTISHGALSVAVALVLLAFPAASFAAETTCVAPDVNTPGVHVPTGSSSVAFHYDCEQSLWISAHYSFDPYTATTTPLDPQVYTYNASTNQWDLETWEFSAAQGVYELRTVSVAVPPAGATTVGGPEPIVDSPAEPASQATSSVSSDGTASAQAEVAGVAGSSSSAGTDSTTSMSATNVIGSIALSGSALVAANTSAGSATSGDATTMLNLINMLQSSNSAFGPGGNAVSFTATINGDVTGDILLDPALIGTIQPAQQPLNTPNSLTTSTTSSTGNIDNTIDLTATTGNATVATNTTAGDATTGTATAVANVINFLNSAVGSGRSFLGVININGNLDGDILLPPNFIDQLLASNVPTVSLAVPDPAGSVSNTTDQSITNAVTASATTGSAIVDSNTTAGNGTTGNATTNITTFNLTGSNIIGENALLVFVNVLGTWYGMIFNAPAGATAAELGGGISATLPTPLATTTQNNTSQNINNDINVAATSGNAAVTRNTTAGNATSGDARAAVNVLNIAHSTLSLANWFGVLFINVFGTWNGSFGIDTIAGTIPLKPTPNVPASAPNEHQVDESSSKPQVFRFVATRFASTQTALANSQTEEAPVTEDGKVLAAETVKLAPAASSPHPSDKAHPNYWITAGFVLIGLAMLTGERLYRSHRH